jgi:hypothetical protein
MGRKERVKRPVAKRTEPDRSWSGAFRPPTDADAGGAAATPGDSGPSAPTGDARAASYDAVNSAYRVVDEYLRQGQRMAEEFWLPPGGGNSPMQDFSRLFERFLRSAGDVGTTWLEMMSKWTPPLAEQSSSPRGAAGPFGAGRVVRQQPSSVGGVEPSSGRSGGLSVSVESSRTFRVSVDLNRADEPGDLELAELAAPDRSLATIRDIRLEVDPSDNRVILRVCVPDGQPPGVYNGLLLERGTQRPRGTVSLSID